LGGPQVYRPLDLPDPLDFEVKVFEGDING
jgi:hypothetical protein